MKKNIIYLIFLISFTIQAQQKINLVVNEKFRVVDTTNDSLISNHNSEREATQSLINYFNKTGSKTARIFYPSQMRIDFEGSSSIHSEVVKDTLTIAGSWHMAGENGNYFRYPKCGEIIKIEADSLIRWQKDIEVIRTKTFGKTEYKLTNKVPFQFVSDTITRQPHVNYYRYQTFATEKHCIKTYVDGIYTGDEDTSCDPGNINYYGIKLYRHSNQISNLQPDTEYKIRVEGIGSSGDFNIIEFKIKTLK